MTLQEIMDVLEVTRRSTHPDDYRDFTNHDYAVFAKGVQAACARMQVICVEYFPAEATGRSLVSSATERVG